MHAPPFRASFLGPRYWPVWLGLGLMRLLHLLPITWQLAFGEALGRRLGRMLGSRRRIVRANLAVAFPAQNAAQREAMVDAHFAALGRGLFEAALAWWSSDARLRGLGTVEGVEHLRAVQAKKQGALLLTGHFTTLELGARFLCLAGVDFHAMYRPYENGLMDYFMHRWRERRSRLPALPRDELRTLVKALRGGASVWYAPDQTLDTRISVYVPFFGKKVATIVATSKLAQMGRAAVVPYFPAYLGGGRWKVVIEPALADFPGPDETADAARVNAVLEAGIRAHAPAEYFWVHRRFKHVPAGEPDIYARADAETPPAG
ncbi:LpxL/LpxP family Kdo(2)-lipid IV(A) lauroyl/palmitoleoyl acyltransferase [Stagnimonas aquatica]|uniref:Lipid A biosynthesis acyltransferase n=1 Tax=Stagnimonas aquatica TaxID=2689987 RepID=A0A3N0V1X6_9GAMM|nr:LpxL/LpxP family Kdo(2)-lipid IV(A) lauroyl/palmitoleoyl acyltransferase [Stagnimonas aquatica]ROH86478.1 LpxL/LpxP family Kdo(2)-lipid IV(A) lauroyl/palmitoleoyl acyltransferase [Stagnimonas aquatica]